MNDDAPAVNDRYHLDYWSTQSSAEKHLVGEVVTTRHSANGWTATVRTDHGQKVIVRASGDTATVEALTNTTANGETRTIGHAEL